MLGHRKYIPRRKNRSSGLIAAKRLESDAASASFEAHFASHNVSHRKRQPQPRLVRDTPSI
jgi:hypothetical protein